VLLRGECFEVTDLRAYLRQEEESKNFNSKQ